MQPYFVELPESEFFTCHDLALAIARATHGSKAETGNRAIWTMASSDSLIEPVSEIPLEQLDKFQVRRPRPESPPDNWRPATSELLLAECARRLVDLEAWVARKDLSIFTASRIKAPVVAPGVYLRRTDAIRYCEESGLEVGSVSSATAPKRTASPAETLIIAGQSALPRNGDEASKASDNSAQTRALPSSTVPKPGIRLLRSKEAISRTGLSRSSFYERQNPKSRYFDKNFPNPVQIGQSAMGYREDELDAWIASRPLKER